MKYSLILITMIFVSSVNVLHAQETVADSTSASAEQAEKVDNFKKAFSACMEGKGYTVK